MSCRASIFNFSQYIQDNIEEGISGVKGENSVKIIGPNLEDLTKLAEQVRDQMSQVRGVADLGIFPVLGQPNLNIRVDRAKAARYGLNSGDVNAVIQAAMGGAVATSVLEGDRQFDLVVRYTPEYRDSIEKIGKIKVGYQTSSGVNCLYTSQRTRHDHFGHRSSLDLPRERAAFHPCQIQCPRPRPWQHCRGGAEADRQERATSARIPLGLGRRVWRPAGSQETLGGNRSRQPDADPRFALQHVQFDADCLLTLAGIPFAVAGGILALYVSGLNFSISAAVGFVSLFGVSVMNGILMITYLQSGKIPRPGAGGRDVFAPPPPECARC